MDSIQNQRSGFFFIYLLFSTNWCLQDTYVVYRPVFRNRKFRRLNRDELWLSCLQDVTSWCCDVTYMGMGVYRHQLSLVNRLFNCSFQQFSYSVANWKCTVHIHSSTRLVLQVRMYIWSTSKILKQLTKSMGQRCTWLRLRLL